MKKVSPEFINYIGIGVFSILSIFELSGIVELIAENGLIITKTKALSVRWLSELAGVIFFVVTLLWVLNIFRKLTELNTRKTLIKLVILFFGFILIQALLSYLISGFLSVQFSDEFMIYFDGLKENYIEQSYLALIPILKYLILGIVFLVERKTIANNVYN